MQQLEMIPLEEAKSKLEAILRPIQQEQTRRQKKSDFLKQCIQCVEKNDFFQLDEFLRSKQAEEILEDVDFAGCDAIFQELKSYADEQIENYRLQFKEGLLECAEKANLPIQIDIPRFTVLKGIEGKIDFATRTTIINQITLRSIDPKRIIAAALKVKRQLYDTPFEAQKFIDSLFTCYKDILAKSGQGIGEIVGIAQLYTEFVWSLQNKSFFQNMDKGKFKGYSVDQFAVDLWRYFGSEATFAEGSYRIKLNPGRSKALWLIDQDGEKRQITNCSFQKDRGGR